MIGKNKLDEFMVPVCFPMFLFLVWHLRARSQGVKTAESWSILGPPIAAKGLLFAAGMASSSSTCGVHTQADSTHK